MIKKKIFDSFYFSLMWLPYIVMELFMGNIKNASDVFTLLIPFLFEWIIGFILLITMDKVNLKFIKCFVLLLVLTGIDQIIKIIMFTFIKSKTINVIGGFVRIRVSYNTYNNAAFSFFNIHMQTGLIISFKIILMVAVVIMFYKLYQKYRNSSCLALSGILLVSGVLSSIIDSSAWGYSLDYINIVKYCIADLKDIYISLGLGGLILYLTRIHVKNNNHQTAG